jgi:hypothetical protein
MFTRKARLITALASVLAVSAVATPIVIAAGDGDDNLAPANTNVTAKLKTGTTANLSGTVQGIAVTVKCTGSSITLKTPLHGLGPVNVSNPTFTGCTDGFGTDRVTSNSTNGRWTATFLDAPNDEAKEVAGDLIKLTIPKAGETIKPSVLAGCTVIVAPTAPASVKAGYNDVNTVSLSSASVPVSGSGCTAGATGKLSATYVVTPGIHDAS